MSAKREPKIVDGVELWECRVCGKWCPIGGFHGDDRTASGIQSCCKVCGGKRRRPNAGVKPSNFSAKAKAYQERKRAEREAQP